MGISTSRKSPVLSKPKASGAGLTSREGSIALSTILGIDVATETSASYANAVNVTGSRGVLQFAAIVNGAGMSTGAGMRITIDGVEACDYTLTTTTTAEGTVLVGTAGNADDGISFAAIPFESSLKIEIKGDGTNAANGYYAYYLTE